MEKFKKDVAELLEVENVQESDKLSAFDSMDSLTMLSIIAYVGDNYNVALTAANINEAKTIGGLEELIKSKIS